jgi:hypothetical protein
MHATGPRGLIPKGGTANLKVTISGAKLASLQELAVKKPVTSDWAVALKLPRRVRALKASTPVGAGKVGAPIINGTQVYWPRVPLREGAARSQKISLKVQVMLEPTVDSNTLAFDAVATNGLYTVHAPLLVRGASAVNGCTKWAGSPSPRTLLCPRT